MTTTLTSQIDSVTVFRRGALVTRTAVLAADSTVRLAPLPLTMDDGSVRVRVHSDDILTKAPIAEAVNVRLEVMSAAESQPAPSDADVKEARERVAKIKARRAITMNALNRVAELEPLRRAQPRDEAPVIVDTTARLAMLRFRRERSEALSDELAAQTEQLRQANEDLAKKEEALREASSATQERPDELRKALYVSMRGATAGAKVTVSYLVPGATWSPSYTVRLNQEMDAAELSVRAMVGQRSGEDWSDVALTLSTASPQSFYDLPELRSIRIGRQQPAPARRGYRPAPVGAAELYADYDRGYADVVRPRKSKPRPAAAAPVSMAAPTPEPAPPPPPVEEVMAAARSQVMMMDAAEVKAMAPGAPALSAPMPKSAPAPRRSRGRAMAKKQKARRIDHKREDLSVELEEADEGYFGASGGGALGDDEMTMSGELSALLNYGAMRMPAPTDSGRGSLRVLSPHEQLVSLLVHQQHSTTIAVVMKKARSRATQIDPLPAGFNTPSSFDGFDFAYVGSHRVDLPSDGSLHNVAISSHEGASAPRYVCVPRESQDVFRFAEIKNPLGGPLLRGPADVYVDGSFLMTVPVDPVPAGGALALGLGVEQSIKVARNTHFKEETTGLLRGSLDLHHQITVDLENLLSREALIEVRDRLPTKRENDDDVELKVERVEPRWEDYEQKDEPIEGGKRWLVKVKPREKQRLIAEYTIRIAPKHELVGGNRRES